MRTLAGSSALVLTFLLAGCGGGDDEQGDDLVGERESPTNSAGSEGSGSDAPGDGPTDAEDPGTETYARGAEVADFCAAMAEIDSAIDESSVGNDEDWDRIVAAFDTLADVGVPDDLPASGVTEIGEVDQLVRRSDSVAELNEAAEDYQPESRTVDDYLKDSCS